MKYNPLIVTSFILFHTVISILLSACAPVPNPEPTITTFPSAVPTITMPIVEPSTQTPYVITATPEIEKTELSSHGFFFISMEDGENYHLFAFSPNFLPLTRLTSDPWDDITPALSPDGNWLVFSSRRNGYWDLYLLDLIGGSLQRLTDSLEFESEPSWSPDGKNIAYTSNLNGNLDIFVRSLSDPGQPIINLTQDESTDMSPTWLPQPPGRLIAFISDRSGDPDVWIANLEQGGIVKNISNSPDTLESHPVWSPDGMKLSWASTDPTSGLTGLYTWDSNNPDEPITWVGSGDWPIWQDDNNLASRFPTPNQIFLTGYSLNGTTELPPILLPGELEGISFGISNVLFPGNFADVAQETPSPTLSFGNNPRENIPSGRASLVNLVDVDAPHPQLIEYAINAFQALRIRVSELSGWDALANLENAYVPPTTPLNPGFGDDWLYTGRAFTLNPALVQANWMIVVREDFGQQVYWRIFLRTVAQDGSQGMPLMQVPWDFSARLDSSTAYENGGSLMKTIPGGYWLDLTALAAQYGWERLPALTNWRTYYTGTRFNELVFRQDLNWQAAMLQLHSPEILETPTLVTFPTRTPTRTSPWYRSPTPTATPTARPTLTSIP